ncbi:MAG: serine--tRNA ligase [Alphaproteobacteria bacterium]|nr:serine--tRNA ligase [Alphaproteobacteria bacterium]
MLDLKWIRDHPQELDQGLIRRGQTPIAQDILNLDMQRRHIHTELQNLQNERNVIAKQVGEAKSRGENIDSYMNRASEIKTLLPSLEEQGHQFDQSLQKILESIPNIPFPEVPDGQSEADNILVREIGKRPEFNFIPKRHFELGENLGLMDFEAAAKISGSRFVVLKGALARLERALGAFMLDIHTTEFHYQEVVPPLLVRDATVYGTGQLPKFTDDLFKTTDDRWLIPTAEVSLTNLVQGDILHKSELPLRFTAFTPCFRSEAGAAGKDTRGMIRQHQFSKVELVSITHPQASTQEHERMTKAAETILERLDLSYRLMLLCVGDTSATAKKTYDLEVWLPGENTYREISSCSNCGDYQARRMNTRFRSDDPLENKPQFVHTLNGSGLAVGRTLIAILENYQTEDGSIIIPKVLQPYMGGLKVISK